MTWGLVITKRAGRSLGDLGRSDIQGIDAALEEMRTDPYKGDIKFLKGTNRTLRRRVGAYRILFEIHPEQRLVVVLAVTRRSSNTY